MLEILEIVIKSAAFSILLLLCWNDAYRAGRNAVLSTTAAGTAAPCCAV